jgi:pantothenate kinase
MLQLLYGFQADVGAILIHHLIAKATVHFLMSREIPMTVRPVFEFDGLANQHVCPFIIMFVGNGRAGKSTRLNQLRLHKLKSDITSEESSETPISLVCSNSNNHL